MLTFPKRIPQAQHYVWSITKIIHSKTQALTVPHHFACTFVKSPTPPTTINWLEMGVCSFNKGMQSACQAGVLVEFCNEGHTIW